MGDTQFVRVYMPQMDDIVEGTATAGSATFFKTCKVVPKTLVSELVHDALDKLCARGTIDNQKLNRSSFILYVQKGKKEKAAKPTQKVGSFKIDKCRFVLRSTDPLPLSDAGEESGDTLLGPGQLQRQLSLNMQRSTSMASLNSLTSLSPRMRLDVADGEYVCTFGELTYPTQVSQLKTRNVRGTLRRGFAISEPVDRHEKNMTIAVCGKCCTQIHENDKLVTLRSRFYHARCFFCHECEERLTHQNAFQRDDKLWCVKHFVENVKPPCSVCKKTITGSSLCTGSDDRTYYHVECLQCKLCKKDLVGVPFTSLESGILVCLDCKESADSCAKCTEPFINQPCVLAMDKYWHPHCFTCCVCDKPHDERFFAPPLGLKVENPHNLPLCQSCVSKYTGAMDEEVDHRLLGEDDSFA